MINFISLTKESYTVKEILEIASETFKFPLCKVKDGIPDTDKALDAYVRRKFSDKTPSLDKARNKRYSKEDVEKFFQDNEVFQYFLERSKKQETAWENVTEGHAKEIISYFLSDNPTKKEVLPIKQSELPKVFSGPVDEATKEFGDRVAANTENYYELPASIIKKAKIDIALDYIFNQCIILDEEKLERDLWNDCFGMFDCPETVKSIFNLENLSSYYTKRK